MFKLQIAFACLSAIQFTTVMAVAAPLPSPLPASVPSPVVSPRPTASPLAAVVPPNPLSLVKRADAVRNPAESYRMQVTVTDSDSPDDRHVYQVFIQGNNQTLVKPQEPARDVGKDFLMQDEDIWAYIPKLGRSLRLGLNQRLTGQAANGDICRMRWSGDYDAKLEGASPLEWVVYLTSKKKGLTYDKLRVWIDKANLRPVRADFLTPSGKPLKKAFYRDYKTLAGMVRPGEIVIQDALRPTLQSTIRVDSMEIESFPSSLFERNGLGK